MHAGDSSHPVCWVILRLNLLTACQYALSTLLSQTFFLKKKEEEKNEETLWYEIFADIISDSQPRHCGH